MLEPQRVTPAPTEILTYSETFKYKLITQFIASCEVICTLKPVSISLQNLSEVFVCILICCVECTSSQVRLPSHFIEE